MLSSVVTCKTHRVGCRGGRITSFLGFHGPSLLLLLLLLDGVIIIIKKYKIIII